jgi:putative transposase
MPRKIYTPEEIVAKLRQVDVVTSQEQSVAEAIRAIGVREMTYYRCRQEFGGLKSDQVKRLKDLETENTRLRRAVSDLTLDKLILQEATRGTAPASSMFEDRCRYPSAVPMGQTGARCTPPRRSRRPGFGYKNHISIDRRHRLIQRQLRRSTATSRMAALGVTPMPSPRLAYQPRPRSTID